MDKALNSSRRRFVASVAGVLGGVVLAGCSSDDVNEPERVTDSDGGSNGGGSNDDGSAGSGGDGGGDSAGDGDSAATETADQGTPETVEAALNDVVEGDRLALVVYGVERTTEIGQFVNADDGNEFVVLDVAAKNKDAEEFISFSSFFQVTLRDSESYEYDQSITGIDNALDSGELAPGEVTRGYMVFEVPQSASGLSLHVDLDESLFQYAGATIDIESNGSGRTLTQDLAVDVYEVGETLEYGQTRFTPNEVRTSMGGEFISPDDGNEIVIVDITVENTGDEELTVSTLLQMELKDAEGWTYGTSISALSALDQGFAQGNPIAPGSERRGEIAFEAEQGLSPLYLLMDFDVFAEGDKSFFQLR